MNVAIATVPRSRTDVTGIQTAITLYTLVMATVITGGKVGAPIGRKRAFAISAA